MSFISFWILALYELITFLPQKSRPEAKSALFLCPSFSQKAAPNISCCTFNTRPLIYCRNPDNIHCRDDSYDCRCPSDTKDTWGKENGPLYCSRIISLVFQTHINASWCSCIVLIRLETWLSWLSECRCWPMWGNAAEALWLLSSCRVQGKEVATVAVAC